MKKTAISYIRIFKALQAGVLLSSSLFIHCPVYAQEPYNTINTLLKKARFATPTDTSYILNLIKSGFKKQTTNPDSALFLFREALTSSYAIHYYEGISGSLSGIGVYYMYKGDFQKSKTALLQQIPYIRFYNIGNTALSGLYINLGAVYTGQGVNDSAIYYYNRALNELDKERIPDTNMLIRVYGNIAATLIDMVEPEQALYYLNKAKELTLSYKKNATELLPIIYGNIGNLYSKKNMYDSSMISFRYALNLNLQQHNSAGVLNDYFSMGNISLKQNKTKIALVYLDSAVQTDKVNARNKSLLQQDLGVANDLSGNYAKALMYYKRALILSKKKGSPRDEASIYSFLAETYKKIGQYRLAYKYQKAFSDLSEELMDEEKIKAINQSEAKYRLSEKDEEILQNRFQLYKQKKQTEQRYIWMGVVVFSSYLLITLAFLLYNNKRKLRKLKVQQEERSRIARDLHDGLGVLLSAVKMNYTVLGKNGALSTAETYNDGIQLLNDMRDELRAVAYNLVPEMMVKHSLTDAVYILCDRVKKGNNIKIDVQIYGDFTVLGQDLYFSVYRILEELVNNSTKHSEATEMLVQLIRHEDKLHITVEDNGKGFDPEKAINGMGLRNLKSRIEKLKGKLQFISQPGMGTSVELEIPYKLK